MESCDPLQYVDGVAVL